MRRASDTRPLPLRRSCPACKAVFRKRVEYCPTDGTLLEPLPRDPLIGTRVGPAGYTIERAVAETPLGRVYRASLGDQRYAVLLMYGDFAALERYADLFARHAARTAAIQHPALVVPTDVGHTDMGVPFLVTRWIGGRRLHDLLRDESPLPATRAAGIAMDMVRALTPLHAAGILHGDLTPDRVVLTDRDGERAVVELARPGNVLGTVPYRSPEQGDASTPDARSDLYSVGAILYEMLAGVPAYDGTALIQALTSATAPPPSMCERVPGVQVHPSAEAIALQLLAPDPNERFQSGGAVLAALATVRSDEVH